MRIPALIAALALTAMAPTPLMAHVKHITLLIMLQHSVLALCLLL